MKRTLLLLGALCATPLALGGALDDEYSRVGGGMGTVQVDGSVHGTVQAFAGMDTLRQGALRFGFEAMLMDASDTNADGVGISAFGNWSMADDVNLFGRAGVDFGGDAGYLVGAGVGYLIEPNMEVRFELVSRQAGNGVQFGLAWYPNRNFYP